MTMAKARPYELVSLYVAVLRRHALSVVVFVASVATVAYVSCVLPGQITQYLRTAPVVTERGRIVELHVREMVVEMPSGSVSIPHTLSLKIGDAVEVKHVEGRPAQVVSVRALGTD
jgi:hypothetical protein